MSVPATTASSLNQIQQNPPPKSNSILWDLAKVTYRIAGPALEIACMALCSGAACVHPAAALGWQTCMQICMLLGFTPTP